MRWTPWSRRAAGNTGIALLVEWLELPGQPGDHEDDLIGGLGDALVRTAKRVPLLRNLLSYTGINPDRLRLAWVSSAEAPRFVEVTSEFIETIRGLGPLSQEVTE